MASKSLLKLSWDYYGEPAQKTAEHHQIHLLEFAKGRNLSVQKTGFERIAQNHYAAFILVEPSDAEELKTVLRPHRTELLEEE